MATPLMAFSIGAASAGPGTRATGTLDVSPRGDEPGTTLPFTVLHGPEPGPVLALIAGVHGSEYVPILALQRLGRAIDPGSLRGTIVMAHAANPPSFFGRTVYYSPVDGRNLNRMFPGRSEGSLSERIADVLTREVIARSSHVVDLHGGDGNESLRPYSYWITTGDPRVAQGSRDLALAFGLDRIVVDPERPTDAAASIYLSNTAITRGKPAITTETGGLGTTDDALIALVERGVAGVLRHLGMRDEGPLPLAAPTWITRNVVLRAGHTGMFLPVVDCGRMVDAGEPLGAVVDFHGRVLESIAAPFAGEVLYVVRTPPITAGEPLAMVGAGEATGSGAPQLE
jgi:predicted deacylase